MEKMRIQVDKDGRELRQSLDGRFPIAVEFQKLSYYARGTCIPHWHPEMEMVIVTEGVLEEQTSEKVYQLREGEGIFINAHEVHGAKMIQGKDCSYRVIRFEPALIGGGIRSRLYEKYINAMLSREDITCCILKAENEQQKKMLNTIWEITNTYVKQERGYELEVLSLMFQFWNLLYKYMDRLGDEELLENKDLYKIQDALAYIQTYYKSPLSLNDISDACSLSKSACCRLFKKVLKQSPMDYVMTYRINQSFALIADEKYTITEVAYETGFTSSSYFTEIFRKVTGTTPTQYKKEIRNK